MNSIKAGYVWTATLFAGFLGGCATNPETPRIVYPATYQIPVGNTRVTADAGGQNLDVIARQRVAVYPGQRVYFRVASPVDVTVRVYARARGPAELVSEMRGSDFTNSLEPKTDELEFTFGVSQVNSSATVQFTISDRPLAPAVAQTER